MLLLKLSPTSDTRLREKGEKEKATQLTIQNLGGTSKGSTLVE